MGLSNSKTHQIIQAQECLIEKLIERIEHVEEITSKLSEELDIIKKEMAEWEDYEEQSTEKAKVLVSHELEELRNTELMN